MSNWYARFPVEKDGAIYFVSGYDMFKIKKNDFEPILCFQSNTDISGLFPSKNEQKIACISQEDGGPDIYVYDILTKSFERLTFFEKNIKIVKFDSKSMVFLSNKDAAFRHDLFMYEYDFATKQTKAMNIGPVNAADFNGQNWVFQRYGYGYINWKNYQGGTAGQLWLDDKKLIELKRNCLQPYFFQDRIYFLHDDGKNGNIFSCKIDGNGLKQHTFHDKFHVQDLQKSGQKFLYTTGGEIGQFDPITEKYEILQLEGKMPHPDSRKFIPPAKQFLTSIATNGSIIATAIRGNVFKNGIFSGGMVKLNSKLRFRLTGVLPNGKVFGIKDAPKSEIHIFDSENPENAKIWPITDTKIGQIKVSPDKSSQNSAENPSKFNSFIAYSSHNHELHIFNYETGEDDVIFSAEHRLHSFDWSANGQFLVYSAPGNAFQSQIRIFDTQTKTHHNLTCGNFYDCSPTFDPSGKFVCFLSNRGIKCSIDGLRFDWSFEHNTKPFLISLQKNQDLLAPWKTLNSKEEDEKEEQNSDQSLENSPAQEKTDENSTKIKENSDSETATKKIPEKFEIDFDKIQDTIVAMPVEEKEYQAVLAFNDSKILLISSARKGEHDEEEEETPQNSLVEIFCMKNLAVEVCYQNVAFLHLSYNKEHSIIEEDGKIKIVKTGEKADDSGYKKNSILDLKTYKYAVNPKEEWSQMMYEVWWLIKTFFWSEELSGIDWEKIWQKYEPYIGNIRTRAELDDLINEIQGEVGTSHAFVFTEQNFDNEKRGFLGCKTEFDEIAQKYKITEIFGSNYQNNVINPILAANSNIEPGDFILAIDDEKLTSHFGPDEALARKSHTKITLTIEKPAILAVQTEDLNSASESTDQTPQFDNQENFNNSSKNTDQKSIKKVDILTLNSNGSLLYRNWVEKNRNYVREKTDGKIGYIHIPDMIATGFKEFFQSYLCEYQKEAIIIDVRYNRGGNVSSLILDQLQRKRLGLDIMRNNRIMELPLEASKGRYIAITNAQTASDGEIFSYSFKKLGLGKIIGERTWGGVVGISPRYPLIDGTLTSQPEFASWFEDIGFSLENEGVSPDFEVINNHLKPNTCENDNQLNSAINAALDVISDHSTTANLEKMANKTNHPKRS